MKPLLIAGAFSIGLAIALASITGDRQTIAPKPLPEELPVPQAPLSQEEARKLVVLRAFLRTIVSVEGTCRGIDPYKTIVTCKEASNFSDHPRQNIYFRRNLTSSAAGAYQFMEETWDGLRAMNVKWFDEDPFTPRNQDLAASLLLVKNGTYPILMEGYTVNPNGTVAVSKEVFASAVNKSCPTWAALPCADGRSAYHSAEWGNQNAKEMDSLWQNFQRFLDEGNQLL